MVFDAEMNNSDPEAVSRMEHTFTSKVPLVLTALARGANKPLKRVLAQTEQVARGVMETVLESADLTIDQQILLACEQFEDPAWLTPRRRAIRRAVDKFGWPDLAMKLARSVVLQATRDILPFAQCFEQLAQQLQGSTANAERALGVMDQQHVRRLGEALAASTRLALQDVERKYRAWLQRLEKLIRDGIADDAAGDGSSGMAALREAQWRCLRHATGSVDRELQHLKLQLAEAGTECAPLQQALAPLLSERLLQS